MYIKKTSHERREFLDRLERKYVRKIQQRALYQESEALKRSLLDLRGKSSQNLKLNYL